MHLNKVMHRTMRLNKCMRSTEPTTVPWLTWVGLSAAWKTTRVCIVLFQPERHRVKPNSGLQTPLPSLRQTIKDVRRTIAS